MEPKIEEKLLLKNIKPTPMRQLVYRMLTQEETALSLSELESKFDKVDKATLYRTLKTFEAHQLIHSIDDGSGSIRYALCDEDCTCRPEQLHLHFVCKICQKTYCLKEKPIPQPDLLDGFTYESANFIVKGVCPSCQK